MQNTSDYIAHIDNSLNKAWQNQSKLSDDVFQVEGMSGRRVRHFFNNLCNFEGCNYLELGTYAGSIIISASYRNNGTFTGVDNFSLFEKPRSQLYANLEKFKDSCKITFHEADYFQIDLDVFKNNVNVFMFDGLHTYDHHMNGIARFSSLFNDPCILIVDDWNDIRKSGIIPRGTQDGIKKAGLNVLYHISVGEEGSTYSLDGNNGWWNGLGIYLVSRNTKVV